MTKKRILILISIILFIIIAAVAGFVGYLQLSLFQIQPITKNAIDTYIADQSLDILVREEDSRYQASLPMKYINDTVTYDFIMQEKEAGRDIVNANIFLDKGYGKVNYLIGSIYVPLYVRVKSEVIDYRLEVTITPESYGKSQLSLPTFINHLVFEDIFEKSKQVQLNLEAYDEGEFFSLDQVELTSSGVNAFFTLELPNLDELVDLISEDLDEDYIGLYEDGTVQQMEALSWIDNYDTSKEVVTSQIFENFLTDGNIIKDALALAKPATLLTVYNKYPELEKLVNEDQVMTSRSKLIGDTVVGYGQSILESLKDYSKGGNLGTAQGYPFDFSKMKTITIDDLVEDYKLEIDDNVISKMSLSYVNNVVYVIYASEEGPYIAITLSGYQILSQEEYQEVYDIKMPSKGSLTEDVETYEALYYALFNFYGEDVFIRYLKNDENEAYGIVSLKSNYQAFKIVLLRRVGGSFEVLGDGYGTAIDVNEAYPDFNMNLATRMNEGNQVLTLNTTTKNNLIEGLIDQGYMDEDEQMIYCSYDGVRYISIELNSGEQYIYTIYRSAYLEDIYTVEEAMANFDDIDPLILLQANPNQDITNE